MFFIKYTNLMLNTKFNETLIVFHFQIGCQNTTSLLAEVPALLNPLAAVAKTVKNQFFLLRPRV